MRNRFQKLTQGFTIIEVMIVLAIAGVIMAIVFLAIPQLQRNSRDNGREAAVTRVKAELETYASTSNGAYPWVSGAAATWDTFYTGYIGTAAAGNKVNDSANGQGIFKGSTGGAGTANSSSNGAYVLACAAVGTTVPTTTNCASTYKPLTAGQAVIVYGGKCGPSTTTNGTAVGSNTNITTTTANYAFIIALDRGTYYCLDNG